jgi:hypothetical protein
VLAELAIANAAFGVIKETIANGGDIMAAGQHIFKFFDSKSEISKKANASGSDSEAFFALEQIKQNEKDLQEMFIYQGRAGLWDDWLKFQADAKRKREAEAKALALAKIQTQAKNLGLDKRLFNCRVCADGVIIIAGLIWLIATKGDV